MRNNFEQFRLRSFKGLFIQKLILDENYSISKPSTSTASKKRCLSMENFDTNKSSNKSQENCQMPYLNENPNEENINKSTENEIDSSVG